VKVCKERKNKKRENKREKTEGHHTFQEIRERMYKRGENGKMENRETEL